MVKYEVNLSDSYLPAQQGEPTRLTTIGTMLRASVAAAPDRPALKELGYDGEIGRVWTYTTGSAILVCGGLSIGATMLLAPMFGAPIQIVYGQTETSPIITLAWCLHPISRGRAP